MCRRQNRREDRRRDGDVAGNALAAILHLSPGAVHATLDRLEKKGLLASKLGPGTPIRAGRARLERATTNVSLATGTQASCHGCLCMGGPDGRVGERQ